jgi:hypothetical protein
MRHHHTARVGQPCGQRRGQTASGPPKGSKDRRRGSSPGPVPPPINQLSESVIIPVLAFHCVDSVASKVGVGLPLQMIRISETRLRGRICRVSRRLRSRLRCCESGVRRGVDKTMWFQTPVVLRLSKSESCLTAAWSDALHAGPTKLGVRSTLYPGSLSA